MLFMSGVALLNAKGQRICHSEVFIPAELCCHELWVIHYLWQNCKAMKL